MNNIQQTTISRKKQFHIHHGGHSPAGQQTKKPCRLSGHATTFNL